VVDREADVVHEQGVAVGRRLGRDVRADRPARAAAIVHDDRLPEAFGELCRDDAPDDVVAAARRERNDEADRTRWIALGRGRRAHGVGNAEQRDSA
jgi:hypothetical protein